MAKKSWNELKWWQKALLIELVLTQISLFASAWWDLNRRTPDRINGSKKAWRAALFLNFVGPLLYFRTGRRLSQWTEADVPDQSGRTVIVTGSNTGIGYDTARVLALRGATVVMACRNRGKAARAAEQIRALGPAGTVEVMELDLADLGSVGRFVDTFRAAHSRLDLLINNAGVMVPPYGITVDGFESQFGVNHLGHFALTGQLLGLLTATPGSRVVTVSSNAHRFGQIDFDDLNWQRKPYSAMGAYGQSKLANLLFTYELQRRLAAAGHDTIAVAAHPGWTATDLQRHAGPAERLTQFIGQPQAMGALPTLYAATAPAIKGGAYVGPSGFAEIRGNPEQVVSSNRSHDRTVAERLWTVSEELTGVAISVEQLRDVPVEERTVDVIRDV